MDFVDHGQLDTCLSSMRWFWPVLKRFMLLITDFVQFVLLLTIAWAGCAEMAAIVSAVYIYMYISKPYCKYCLWKIFSTTHIYSIGSMTWASG